MDSCGLGRVGEHLSAHFAHYIGVDISRSHLDQAIDRFNANGRKNSTFRLLPEMLGSPDQVDLAFSIIVLQHNPPPVIALLIKKMSTMVRRGGIVYFQVPVAIQDYHFNIASYLTNPPKHGLMEMHCLPQHEIFRLLDECGCMVLEVLPDNCIGPIGLSYAFLARKI